MMEYSPECPLPPAPPNQRKKKLRDLPNLSDCHCCNRRINYTIPKNRLRILTSEWRIVLLCKSCYRLVESSQICSYCLTGISSKSMDSFFECKRCHRRIHKNCISKFSYGSGGELTVCFDCWVPECVENDDIRVSGCKPKRKIKMCGDSANLGSSRGCDSQEEVKSLEMMVNERNVVAQEKATDKAMVERNEPTGTLSVVGAIEDGGDMGKLGVDDDAQFAIQLHRVMNSSPRITRNSCLLNTVSGSTALRKSSNVGDEGNAKSMDNDSMSCKKLEAPCLDEVRQDILEGTRATQDEKHNKNSYGGLVTYRRRRRASQDERCIEEPVNGHLKMYARRNAGRPKTKIRHCIKTYMRRRLMTSPSKIKFSYGDVKYEHGMSSSSIGLNCCEDSRAVTNVS